MTKAIDVEAIEARLAEVDEAEDIAALPQAISQTRAVHWKRYYECLRVLPDDVRALLAAYKDQEAVIRNAGAYEGARKLLAAFAAPPPEERDINYLVECVFEAACRLGERGTKHLDRITALQAQVKEVEAHITDEEV